MAVQTIARNSPAAVLDALCRDARAILAGDPGPGGQETLRKRLLPVLTDSDFLASYGGPDKAPGSHLLYTDPELGFTILMYVGRAGRGESPPHDHGDDWAIYGQSALHTDMRDFEIVSGDRFDGTAVVRETRSYRLNPGDAHLYRVGDIHSINPVVDCRYVRIAGSPADHFTPVGPVDEETRAIWGAAFTERPQRR